METTIANVKSQLMYEWDEQENDDGDVVPVRGKQVMGEKEAIALIVKHQDIYDRGVALRSFAYYTANQIRNAESKPIPKS